MLKITDASPSTSASSRNASCAPPAPAGRTSTRSRPQWSCVSTSRSRLAARGRCASALAKLAGALTDEGILIIRADRFRTQERNREDARERLAELVLKATVVPKRRVPTKPSRASKARRRDDKKKRGHVKRLRGSRDLD